MPWQIKHYPDENIELTLMHVLKNKYTETIKLCPLDVYVCQFQMYERISFNFHYTIFNHLEMICT